MKSCSLCKSTARLYCESDQAGLCWDCDSKVHGANFLVARHSRNLLCDSCQSPTPWSASGAKLTPTASVCRQCYGEGQEDKVGVAFEQRHGEKEGEVRDEIGGEDALSFDGDDEDDEFEDESEEASDSEDDEDNQVVPWSISPLPPPPPPVSSPSCSSSDDYGVIQHHDSAGSESPISVPFKRERQTASDLKLQNEIHDNERQWRSRRNENCESVAGASGGDCFSVETGRILKVRRIESIPLDRPGADRSGSIIESIGLGGRGRTPGQDSSRATNGRSMVALLDKVPGSS